MINRSYCFVNSIWSYSTFLNSFLGAVIYSRFHGSPMVLLLDVVERLLYFREKTGRFRWRFIVGTMAHFRFQYSRSSTLFKYISKNQVRRFLPRTLERAILLFNSALPGEDLFHLSSSCFEYPQYVTRHAILLPALFSL